MSFFLTYAADSEEYLLKPAGYGLLIILLAALLFVIYKLGKVSLKTQKMQTKQLVYCSAAMALAVVTSYIKVASLPFGGSITLFSMMFICLIGYIYGAKTGLITGMAYESCSSSSNRISSLRFRCFSTTRWPSPDWGWPGFSVRKSMV